MVGKIIYKNFETGSYKEMRLTVFHGVSYADMEGNDSFSSYVVDLEKNKVTKDYSSKYAPECTMNRIISVAKKAADFLYCNEYVTIAEFAENGADIKTRKVSSKEGVFSPVDFRAVFHRSISDAYKLVSELPQKSYMYRSVLCSVLNYCISNVFDIEEEMFGMSGVGIYINLALFKFGRKSLATAQVPQNIRRLIKTRRKKQHMLGFPRTVDNFGRFENSRCNSPRRNIVCSYRFLKGAALRYVLSVLPKEKSAKAITSFVLSLANDEKLNSLCEDFTQELADFAHKYDFLFEAKSHAEYLGVKDVLRLALNSTSTEKIIMSAAAASANMKLRSKLPSPPYYDSNGRAYW